MSAPEYMWRYQSSLNSLEELDVHELKLLVIKHNPCSVWVDFFGTKKIVYTYARKKFAYPTKEEALQSFLIRKRKHRDILRRRLDDVERSLDLFTAGKYKIIGEVLS